MALNGCSVPNTATNIQQTLQRGLTISDVSTYNVTWVCGNTPASGRLNVCGWAANGGGVSQACY